MVQVKIKHLISTSLKTLNLDSENIHLEHPGVPEHGDYASNIALQLAKSEKKSPRALAEQIVKNLPSSDLIEKTEIAGPGFINFHLSAKFLWNEIELINSKKESYGAPSIATPKKISIEHTQVNPNKEPHVGHLRNAVIGDALVQVFKFVGHKVTTLYYQNDIGQQIASIVLAYKKEFVKRSNFPTLISWASSAYQDIEARLESDTTLQKEKEQIQIEITKGTNEDAKLADEITTEILKSTLRTLQKLHIKYDLIVRESDIANLKLWEKTFELLKKNNAFYLASEGEKKGCWLIKIQNAEDKILVRSNGVPTYAGNDIANHLWKFGALDDFKYITLNWKTQTTPLYSTSVHNGDSNNNFSNADAIVNIIDNTQTYPQESVKEALRVLGYKKEAENYHHVNYGFVYLSKKTAEKLNLPIEEGANRIKISGRKGTVVTIETFLKKVENILEEKFGKFSTIETIRNGAIKFELLKYNTYEDVVFDLDSALDVNGFTGPYIQYAYTRAVNVLKKSKRFTFAKLLSFSNKKTESTHTDKELPLLRKLYQLEEVVERAMNDFAPHYICLYLFELSQTWNSFYNENRIIGSENEKNRLNLTKAVSEVLKNGLSLLNIQAPEKM